MANTYTLIDKATVGSGGVATVTFTSIPQTYTDLKLVASARSTYTANAYDYWAGNFNGVTSNYSNRVLNAYYASTISSSSGTGFWGGAMNASHPSFSTSNTFTNSEMYIPNYTSGNYKSYSIDSAIEQNGTTGNELDLIAQLWSNIAAITSITLSAQNANFAEFSSFYLYGIKNS